MIEARVILLSLVGVLALTALATGLLVYARAPKPFGPALAVLRGTLQLAAISLVLAGISLVLAGIIRSPFWIGVALVMMFSVAAWTAARRVGSLRERFAPVAAAMVPTTDQRRTTGLVTLPGAFVAGALTAWLAPVRMRSATIGA